MEATARVECNSMANLGGGALMVPLRQTDQMDKPRLAGQSPATQGQQARQGDGQAAGRGRQRDLGPRDRILSSASKCVW
jgi:hypothetical protein